MRIFDVWLARGPARFDRAIAHVVSWLGNELRRDAVPARLRGAAGRLATLIDAKRPEPAREAQDQAISKVVALEDLLEAKALCARDDVLPAEPTQHARDVSLAHGPARDEPPAGVCPFTGMRADGTLAVAPEGTPGAKDPTVERMEPHGDQRHAAEPRRKKKERLAGADAVENTSARSAARPARKQPRSRAQATRKKA